MSNMLSIFPKEDIPALLAIDDDEKTVYVDGRPCELTQQEFSLLKELSQNIHRAVSREELLREAWGYVCPGDTRTVDVHVQRLRAKLGNDLITTVYRQGYCINPAALNRLACAV